LYTLTCQIENRNPFKIVLVVSAKWSDGSKMKSSSTRNASVSTLPFTICDQFVSFEGRAWVKMLCLSRNEGGRRELTMVSRFRAISVSGSQNLRFSPFYVLSLRQGSVWGIGCE